MKVPTPIRFPRTVDVVSVALCALLWTVMYHVSLAGGATFMMEEDGRMVRVYLGGVRILVFFLVVFAVLHWLFLKEVLRANGRTVRFWLGLPLGELGVGCLMGWGYFIGMDLWRRGSWDIPPELAFHYLGGMLIRYLIWLWVALWSMYLLTVVTQGLVRAWYGAKRHGG